MDLWNRCKAIRDGRTTKHIRKTSNELFPLRGFVTAPCDHPLTGALSRGKSGARYGYYFCSQRDSGNYPVSLLHDKFVELLAEVEPPKEAVNLYFELFLEEVSNIFMQQKNDGDNIEKRRIELKKKQDRLVDLRVDGEIDKETFQAKKHKVDIELESLTLPQSSIEHQNVNWDEVAAFGKSFVTNIPEKWQSLEIQEQILYQSSIFPKKLQWDGLGYRTPYLLEVLTDINNVFKGDVSSLSHRWNPYSTVL